MRKYILNTELIGVDEAQRASLGLNPADVRANIAAAPADVPSGQTRAVSKDPKIANLQHEIDETIGVMSKNIEGMAERGERLQDLQHKTGE